MKKRNVALRFVFIKDQFGEQLNELKDSDNSYIIVNKFMTRMDDQDRHF